MPRARRLPGLAMAVVLLGPAALPAQAVAPAATPAEPSAPAADSPRETVRGFLEQARGGDYAAAARYLAPAADPARAPELARRLKAVLDRRLWVDLEALSPLEGGHEADGLPPGVDEIGRIPLAGRPMPVRIERRSAQAGPAWLFTPETVARVDAWYDALDDRWLRERLPDALLRPGPFDLAWWQWVALAAVAALAWAIARVLGWVTLRLLARAVRRTSVAWDDALLDSVRGPIVLGWAITVAYPLAQLLDLYPPAQAFVGRGLGVLGLLTFFWALWRGVGVLGEALRGSAWAKANATAQSALSIGTRIGRVAVLALGLVAALTHLGYPVAGLLAGLGLGGLAFALAAQKTVENLFGSLSLAVDAPFRVGDFVKVDDFVGTVEALGLRSTRIRTLDRTLVTIPNGRLADMRLESYTARDRMRLACIVGLVYSTTAAQMRQVLEGLEGVLRGHPKIWPDAMVVRFKEFGPSSLDIEIMAWFETPVWAEFQLIRQEVLLQFMEVVEKAGTSFAFPTRTVHLVNEAAPAPGPAGRGEP